MAQLMTPGILEPLERHDKRTVALYFKHHRAAAVGVFDEAVSVGSADPQKRDLVNRPGNLSGLRRVPRVLRGAAKQVRHTP